jgi:hypothetical protein
MKTDANAFAGEYGVDALREQFDNAAPIDPTPLHAPNRIRLIPFNDIKLNTAPRYLVRHLIPRTGLIVVWGPPKCGKSFVVFDLFMCVALGRDYRARRVQQGAVVYCAFEGQSGFEARVEAFRRQCLGDHDGPVPFHLQPATLALVRDHKALIAAIRHHLAEEAPAAVILDTLNRSFEGSESSDEDMTAYVRAADAIREAFNCAVIIIHHCGIEGSRPRGHSSLSGAVDVARPTTASKNEDFNNGTVGKDNGI